MCLLFNKELWIGSDCTTHEFGPHRHKLFQQNAQPNIRLQQVRLPLTLVRLVNFLSVVAELSFDFELLAGRVFELKALPEAPKFDTAFRRFSASDIWAMSSSRASSGKVSIFAIV